jgi:hypothetical protein
LPPLTEREINRDRFTEEQLRPYESQWVAFSRDCARIVAGAPDLLELDRKVLAAGEDPEQVCLEFIPATDENWPGGVDFG